MQLHRITCVVVLSLRRNCFFLRINMRKISPVKQKMPIDELLMSAPVWSINGRFLSQTLSGVQRYAWEIVSALDALAIEGHPLTREVTLEIVTPPGVRDPGLQAIPTRQLGRIGGHVWEQMVLPLHVKGGLLSLCNTGPLAVRRQVLCIHDLNTRIFPKSYSLPFRMLYRTLIPALGRTVKRLATVSHYSAAEIARYGVAPRAKIDVMYNGHEHALRWLPKHSVATQAAAGPNTILVVGSPAPHKNVGLLLGMADKLAALGLRVTVVGASDPRIFGAAADISPDASNITWLGRVTDNELAALYKDSLCLAFPSFVEGFGIPAVEAMAWGCPVITSDRTALPETCGDAALYASPEDGATWLEQFKTLQKDSALRTAMIERGKRQAAKFSWRRSAEQYLEVLAAIR
jgi:glycosyltransferase involved in cell wall biosynthesis